MRASPRTASRALAAAALLAAACTTPAERGERLYREGDRLGALEIWRSIPENARAYPAVQQRIPMVEAEFQRLVVRYKQRARYYESKGRLAESILNDRLALELQPDDAATLARVQALARTLAARKAELMKEYRASFTAGDLASARRTLAQLHTLDAFDPELETEARNLGDALRSEVSKQIAMGRRGFASGNFTAAQSAFESVLELDPDNESAQGYISYIDTLRRERNRSGKTASASGSGSGSGSGSNFAGRDTFASQAEIRAEGLPPEWARGGTPGRLLRRDPAAALRPRRQRRPRRRAAGAGPAAPAARPRGRETDRERAPGLPQRGPAVGHRRVAPGAAGRSRERAHARLSRPCRAPARKPRAHAFGARLRSADGVAGCRRSRARSGSPSRSALLAGCANTLDLERARRVLESSRPAEPVLIEDSPVSLPAPEGVSASSGELRTVPLRWEPVISADVGGYIVERALAAEGPFTRVAVLPGSNTTLWVDDGPGSVGSGEAAGLGDGVTAFYRVRSFATPVGSARKRREWYPPPPRRLPRRRPRCGPTAINPARSRSPGAPRTIPT